MEKERRDLLDIYGAALHAVSGDFVVRRSLIKSDYSADCHVIAIGKVADSMMQGALDVLQDKILSGFLISKKENFSARLLGDERMQCVAGDHPVPAENTLFAGRQLLNYIEKLPSDARCLFLISGGASSLVEVLEEGVTLKGVREINNNLLASGKNIHDINRVRKSLSRIKGGGLWQYLGDKNVRCLLISDVQGDDPAVIGSGLLFSDKPEEYPDTFSWEVVANLEQAKLAAKNKAEWLGYSTTVVDKFMCRSAEDEGRHCVGRLDRATTEIVIWGGETTVELPKDPVNGGRNQHLALSAAIALAGKNHLWLLSIATDGVDGNTQEAGALVDGRSMQRGELYGVSAAYCLQRANSNLFLEESGDLIRTGASKTNVMDLMIGLKRFN